ncbi:hypothetical protein CBR_g48748 [Chara braunii]|uniref:NmrA-like domain-containing protein n=1 Tax=Chara braunii TaxID=69332 RepID=A0A388K4Q5_CHABU|nr:hypothetical protein CBR_g48748 [Chara braunii]|eukprot:GBG64999.1 hypothetical protein CBR_g48748 [Chara braunii]
MAAEKKHIVVVFGATGAQGGSVVKHLLEDGKYAVRGVTRNVESAKSKKLAAMGVEMVAADQSNYDQVKAAFKDAYAAFVVTFFWDPASMGKEQERGGMAAKAAKEAGVTHYLWSTLPNVEEQSGGKWHVPHFTDKAKVEPIIRGLGFKYHTFISPNFYYSNFKAFGMAREREDGSVAFLMPHYDANTVHSGYDVDDMGLPIPNVLDHPEEYHDKYIVYEGFTAPIKEWLHIFTKVTGKSAVLDPVPPNDYVEELVQMFGWFKESGYYGKLDRTASVDAAFPRPLTTWKEYLLHKWD